MGIADLVSTVAILKTIATAGAVVIVAAMVAYVLIGERAAAMRLRENSKG